MEPFAALANCGEVPCDNCSSGGVGPLAAASGGVVVEDGLVEDGCAVSDGRPVVLAPRVAGAITAGCVDDDATRVGDARRE